MEAESGERRLCGTRSVTSQWSFCGLISFRVIGQLSWWPYSARNAAHTGARLDPMAHWERIRVSTISSHYSYISVSVISPVISPSPNCLCTESGEMSGSIPGLGTPFSPEYGYSLHQEWSLKRLWTIGKELMTKHACLARPSAFTTNRAVELHSLQRIPPT